MKNSMLLLPLFMVGCQTVLSERRNWDFIQDVGGLEVIGQDSKHPDWLVIHGDVSGIRKFSDEPTLMNSDLSEQGQLNCFLKES